MTTATNLESMLAEKGYTLNAFGMKYATDGDWEHFAFTVKLMRNGVLIWEGPYKLGLGHVTIPSGDAWKTNHNLGLTENERGVLNTLQRKPYAKFKNPMDSAVVGLYTKIALRARLAPKLEDVLCSLLRDADGSDQPFEDWCDDLGYDSDSIKAKGIWETCNDIRRVLVSRIPSDELAELSEAFSDY